MLNHYNSIAYTKVLRWGEDEETFLLKGLIRVKCENMKTAEVI